MAPPPIHICVRRTLNWKDRASVDAHLIPTFRQKVEMWNATLRFPYHLFRQRLKEIAELSLSRVEGAILSSIDEVPAGHLIAPIDDDDWFAPDLVHRLRAAYDASARGYLWRRHVIEPPPRLRTGLGWLRAKLFGPATSVPHICKTNNYALASGMPDGRMLLLGHMQASRYVDAHAAEVKRLPVTLAVQNRNVASQTALAWMRPTIDRRELLRTLERYRGLYRSFTPAEDLRWAQPYVDRMAELMDELRVR